MFQPKVHYKLWEGGHVIGQAVPSASSIVILLYWIHFSHLFAEPMKHPIGLDKFVSPRGDQAVKWIAYDNESKIILNPVQDFLFGEEFQAQSFQAVFLLSPPIVHHATEGFPEAAAISVFSQDVLPALSKARYRRPWRSSHSNPEYACSRDSSVWLSNPRRLHSRWNAFTRSSSVHTATMSETYM